MKVLNWKNRKKEPSIFFVRGQPKSGTNWVGRLLNLHPSISIKGEFQFQRLFKEWEHSRSHRFSLLSRHPKISDDHFYNLIKSIVFDVCGHLPLCGDRSPGPVQECILPEGKCIYISRDGRDVLVSWTFHAFRNQLHTEKEMKDKQKKFHIDHNYYEKNPHELLSSEEYVRHLAKKWNDYIVSDFAIISDHNLQKLPIFHIKYEDLHKDIQEFRDKLYLFLGVNPRLAEDLNFETKPGFGGRIDNTSFNRRGTPYAWCDYFNSEQLNWFMEEAEEAIILQSNAKSGIVGREN